MEGWGQLYLEHLHKVQAHGGQVVEKQEDEDDGDGGHDGLMDTQEHYVSEKSEGKCDMM